MTLIRYYVKECDKILSRVLRIVVQTILGVLLDVGLFGVYLN